MFLPSSCNQMSSPCVCVHNSPPVLTPLQILASAIQGLQDSVASSSQSLALKRQHFENTLQHAEAINQGQRDCEYLDVGGTRFHARRTVLEGRGQHFLSMLVAENFATERATDGSLFIDRDPRQFALILQYLREEVVDMPAGVDALQLEREARFYGLSDLGRLVGMRACLTVMMRACAPAHAYDIGSNVWRQLPGLASPPGDEGPPTALAFNAGRLTALVHRAAGWSLDELDPVSLVWKSISAVPLSGTSPQLVGVGPHLYCSLSASRCVVRYEGHGHWQPLPESSSRRCFSMCAFRDGVAVVGGKVLCQQALVATALGSVEHFCRRAGRWKRLPEMQLPRCYPGVGVWRGRLIVAGGQDSRRTRLLSVEAYDPDTGTWQLMASMTCAYNHPMVAVYEDTLLVIGGKTDGFTAVEQYDPGARQWTKIYHVSGVEPDSATVMSLTRRLWT